MAMYKGYLQDKNGNTLLPNVSWENIIDRPNPYPIGAIYLSVDATNPGKLFGGTWEQIAKGRTLVGVDISDADFNTVKKTGGSKYLQEHTHNIFGPFGTETGWHFASNCFVNDNKLHSNFPGYVRTEGAGNSGNLQPYFTCYIWCRTA